MKFKPCLLLVIVALGGLHPACAEAAPVSAQDTFAGTLAAALIAEKDCGRPGEIARAQRFIKQWNSGFDTLANKADGHALVQWMFRFSVQFTNMGREAWCEEYAVKYGHILQAYR